MSLLETPIMQLTGAQYVELTQGASTAIWLAQIGVVAFVAMLLGGLRRWWRARKQEAPPLRPDWCAPCPACGTICQRPPLGWSCSRAPGHEGPCAASPESRETGHPRPGSEDPTPTDGGPSEAA